jgi:NADH-ubiquinone oxidoreductase chain 5
MTGFFSKDFILESSYGQYHLYSIVIYVIALIGAIFTTLYSVKILYLTFLTSPNGSIYYYKNAHEGNIFISLPLIILALFSIYFGFLTKDIYIGLGSGFLDNSIFIHPSHEISIDTEFSITGFLKLLPLFLTLFIISISVLISELYPFIVNNFKLSNIGYLVFGFFNQRFLIELFYNKFIVNMILLLGGQTTKTLDKGSIELIGPYGIQKIALIISKIINNLNNGIVTNYGLYIVIGIIIYLINIILNSFFFLIFGVVLLFMLNI